MCDSTSCVEAAASSRRSFLRSTLAAALAVANDDVPGSLETGRAGFLG